MLQYATSLNNKQNYGIFADRSQVALVYIYGRDALIHRAA